MCLVGKPLGFDMLDGMLIAAFDLDQRPTEDGSCAQFTMHAHLLC